MLREEEKKEIPEISHDTNHCMHDGTRERGELNVTRDVISANEIVNRVNWRRGLQWHVTAMGIKYRKKVFSFTFLAALFSSDGVVQLCDQVMHLIFSDTVEKLQCCRWIII